MKYMVFVKRQNSRGWKRLRKHFTKEELEHYTQYAKQVKTDYGYTYVSIEYPNGFTELIKYVETED